eukprot:gene19463-23272_t
MAGDLTSQEEPSGKNVIGPFVFPMHMMCPTHCASAARVLGLFRERTFQTEVSESAQAKQVLHILFRAVAMWSRMADDLKNEDVAESDLPRIVIKFVQDRHQTHDRSLAETMQAGDGAWLDGYERLRYMLIFFVFDDANEDEDDEEDQDENEHAYKLFANKILREMYVENQKRDTGLSNAYINATSKNGMRLAKKMQIEKQNLMDRHLDATGNSLDCETCIDLSYAPTSANDMHRIIVPFLTSVHAPSDFQRRTDADIYFSTLFPSDATHEDMLRKYERSHPDIDWSSLLVSTNNGASFSWNLNTPFVIRIGMSDFTSVVWERTIQPTFATILRAPAEDLQTGETSSHNVISTVHSLVDEEAEESFDGERSTVEEDDTDSENEEDPTDERMDAEEQLVRQERRMQQDGEITGEDGDAEVEEGLECFSVYYMGKRAREIVARNMRRPRKESRTVIVAAPQRNPTAVNRLISY